MSIVKVAIGKTTTFFAAEGNLHVMGLVDTSPIPWVTLGGIAEGSGIILDSDDWPMFVELVNGIDEVIKQARNGEGNT